MPGKPRGGASPAQRAQQDADREKAKERAKELDDRQCHKDPNHPVPGSQAWADRNGL